MDDQVISDISRSIGKIRTQHGNLNGSREQQWIQDHVINERLQQVVPHLSIVAFHMLSAIENGELTGIQIAQQLHVTRGGVTRAAQKLIQYGLIHTSQHPDDKKKIYYSLTADGQALAAIHDRLHQKVQAALTAQLTAKYSPAELQVVAHFLDDLYHLEGQL